MQSANTSYLSGLLYSGLMLASIMMHLNKGGSINYDYLSASLFSVSGCSFEHDDHPGCPKIQTLEVAAVWPKR